MHWILSELQSEVEFMAMINCPECGKEISDSAISCPNCGYSILKKRRRKKLSIRKNIIFDAIANSVIGCLFILFLFTDNFFEYIGVDRINGKYDYDFNVNGFDALITFGTDINSEVIICFLSVIVVLILFLSWFKCFKPNLQNKKTYTFINMLLTIVLGVVFFVIVFIAKEGISDTHYSTYMHRVFSSFLFGFYIEVVLIVLLIALAVFNYAKINLNLKKKNKKFDFQAEQGTIVVNTDISENNI